MQPDPMFWNALADDYAKKPVENPEAFERKIAITRERMRPGHIVLDIGCGTGSLALRLADAGREVHGLDFSSEMVRIAEDKAARAGVDNVRFHRGFFDERFAAFGPESLDGICAYSILHLVEDRAETLARIHRLLKPGGFFISSTVCLREGWVPYAAVIRVMQWMGKAPFVSSISRRAIEQEIVDAGFVDVETPDVGAESTVAFITARKPSPAA